MCEVEQEEDTGVPSFGAGGGDGAGETAENEHPASSRLYEERV